MAQLIGMGRHQEVERPRQLLNRVSRHQEQDPQHESEADRHQAIAVEAAVESLLHGLWCYRIRCPGTLAYYSPLVAVSVTDSSPVRGPVVAVQRPEEYVSTPDPKVSPAPESGEADRRWLYGVVALCVLSALLALISTASWAVHRRELVSLLRTSGVAERHPSSLARVERENTSHHARLLTARSLIYDSLSRLGTEGRSAELDQELLEILPRAHGLALSALRNEPGSWQAPMLVGMATYLEWSLSQDARLYTEASTWERPLQEAVDRAAGHPEPRRLLAGAYLETWPGLSPAKKELAKTLLKQVFDDDLRAFEALLPAWLGLRLEQQETFSVVPDQSSAWRTLARGYAHEKRWRQFKISQTRFHDVLAAELEARRLEAEKRMALGDYVRSRNLFLLVIVDAPVSGRFLPILEKVLATYPPGLHSLRSSGRLHDWLDWLLRLGRVDRLPLSPDLLARLIDAVGELPPAKAALAGRLADDRYQAERFERLSQALGLREWAPYLVAKARAELKTGEAEAAAEALALVAPSYRRSPSFVVTELQVAQALGAGPRLEAARQAWQATAADTWSGLKWQWPEGRASLEMLTSRSASGLRVRIVKAPRDGAVVEPAWNGSPLEMSIVRAGDWLRLPVEVAGDRLHLLTLNVVSQSGAVTPGEVRLEP